MNRVSIFEIQGLYYITLYDRKYKKSFSRPIFKMHENEIPNFLYKLNKDAISIFGEKIPTITQNLIKRNIKIILPKLKY